MSAGVTVIDQSLVRRAHEQFGAGSGQALPGVRDVVLQSWLRSRALRRDPDRGEPATAFDTTSLRQARAEHPLRPVLPVLERLLAVPAAGTGLVVAVADAEGRLLWAMGDRDALRRASGMGFEPGTDWSEASIGTSAPGTALATGAGVQIRGAEHFTRTVHPWSCTAVPVRDPHTGRILGVVDLTGDELAVADHSMALVDAAVAAAQSQLAIHRSEQWGDARPRTSAFPLPAAAPPGDRWTLRVLGDDEPSLDRRDRDDGRDGQGSWDSRLRLRLRHAEILTLLGLHPAGLSGAELAELLGNSADEIAGVTLRAEMARLRKVLEEGAPQAVPGSRPYRLPATVTVDVLDVRRALADGDLARAVDLYCGPLLPGSESATVRAAAEELAVSLRNAVLDHAGPDTLCAYLRLPEAAADHEAWHLALRILPPASPRRSLVVSHLEALAA